MTRNTFPTSASAGGPVSGRVVVRPVAPTELPRWLELMRHHHYLGFGKSAGKRILYVATLDGEWVALLSWAAAALHVKCRDQWIGWDKVVKRRRLHHVTNNTRFLILPGVKRPNLASRILALNIKRLASDWLSHHDYTVYLAETFVDPLRFHGTCYLAQGWTLIGMTQGYGHDPRGGYQRHGNPKKMFVRELVHDARERLSSVLQDDCPAAGGFMLDVNRLPIDVEGGLLDLMREIPSVRQKRCATYAQSKILALSACALLSGARSYHGIIRYMNSLLPEQLNRLGFSDKKLPSRWAIQRLLGRIDGTMFDRHVSDWLTRVWQDRDETPVLTHSRMGGSDVLLLLAGLKGG